MTMSSGWSRKNMGRLSTIIGIAPAITMGNDLCLGPETGSKENGKCLRLLRNGFLGFVRTALYSSMYIARQLMNKLIISCVLTNIIPFLYHA